MYDKEAIKRGIYEKYAKADKEDEFFSMKIDMEEDTNSRVKLGNIAAIIIFGLLIGTVRICNI